MKINIGLAQIYPKLGDVQANLEKQLDYVKQAEAENVDLLVFPEMSLTGHQVQDLAPKVAIRAEKDDTTFAAMLDASQKMDIMFGFVRRNKQQRLFTSCAYLSAGECLHIHDKIYLPTYTLFDEGRFFDAGDSVRTFETRFGRVGMLICEDFWHISLPYMLWLNGAEMLLLQSASPGRGLSTDDKLDDTRFVELANQTYGSMFSSYVIHCNRVGYEDGKNFYGGSSIVDPNGNFMINGVYFDEILIVRAVDLNQVNRTRSRLPLLRDERLHLVQRELARILVNDR